jgi:hypothetical protein
VSKQSASALLAGLVAELDPAAEDRRQMELGRAASWSQEPVGDVSQDIAPEAPAVVPNELIRAADAAFLQEPYTEPALPDEDLPPVQRQSASALLAGLKVEAPAKQPRASASALLAELQVATPAPEAKPLNISFGGPEASLAAAVRGEPKKPVTTPEAADGSDVTFDAKGPAFQFTGTLVMDPSSGAEQGLDGMVPVAPRGPMAAAVGQAEPVLNRRPRLVPSAGGQIVFDQSTPERFTQGVEEAFAAGILPQSNYEKIKAAEAQIFKVVDDRRKLEEKAQADPKLLAVLQGLGRGGAMTAGAVAGAKAFATAGSMAAAATGVGVTTVPVVAAVTGTAGAIVGGVGAGLAYDALYRQLGQHFEEYDNVMKSAELYPMHKAGGELAMAGLAIGTSVPQAVRGLQTAYQAGGLPQVARTAGAAGGLGAGTGVVAYPIDAVVRGEEMTPGGFATAAGTGALSGGFFINNRMARTPEVMRIFAKADAGSKLTAAEETIYRAAYGPLQAAVRRGQVDGQRLVDGRVEVPTTSVAGMMPAAGRARVQARYESPMRLPEGALQAARDYASRPRPVATPPPAATTAAPTVPRQAPVNVIPPGETIIPPPPMTPAMMTPDAFADAMATERGLDMDFNPEATEQLFGEHFRIVREAINNNQPVNAAALELYEMQVPYYVTDETTGLSQFDQASFDAWQGYVSGRGEEVKQDAAEAGAVELLAAIRELGGLPAPKSGGKRAVWKGELQSLYETSRGARDLGIKGAMGLFRKDAPDVDYLVIGLREKGFRVETEADLFELLDNRLRNGRDVFAYPTMAADQFAPVGGRMGRRAPRPAPGQMDLLGERDVEFTLAGQTDRSSLTPEEMAMAQRTAEEKAQAEALQGDLFGEKRGSRRATKDLLGREISPDQLAFNEQFLLSGVVDPALTSTYATDFPDMAANFAEQEQAIGGPNFGQSGLGVVRVYSRQGARESTVNEFQLPAGAQPVAEFTPAQVRAGEHLKWFAQRRTAEPSPRVQERPALAATELQAQTALQDLHQIVGNTPDQLQIEDNPDGLDLPEVTILNADFDGVEFQIEHEAGSNSLYLRRIEAHQMGRGAGTRFLQTIKQVAEKHGVSIVTDPMPMGETSERRLNAWYKRNGFLPNQGQYVYTPKPGLYAGTARIAEPTDLTSPDPQAYFDFSNVPVSKQPAGAAAVQAAAQANDTPYQAAPVSAAGGVAGDVGLADARSRQAAAYRALLGGDAAAVAEAIKNGVPLSRLMLGYISRESASFNIRGAIIKSPKDLALYNLAHRTPFFESLKIAVLDDREQVIHSQVVSTGTLNEALAHPRDFAAIVLAAKEANPKAKVIGFMIMHNHPSGDPSPSDADRAITRRFSEVGDLIGVPLLDHVITNGESYVSFMLGGMLSVPKSVKLARSDARPRLPVLPAPEGQIGLGQMAAFEAVPASDAIGLRVRDPKRVKMVHETLQTADPNMIHVINVDTRYGILSVVRHPMDVKPADIIKATSPAGAYAMVVSLPAMPQDEARSLMLRLQTAASLMQIHLLDAAMVGMDQSFKQQKILETPEAPYGSADIGPISSDPLTVPPQFKSAGGGAKVPPGTPAGSAPAAGVPDWVLQPGETSEGRRLIKGIENFKPGQRWGYRTIVDFVNKAVNVEIRYSRSQTSATHPANYKPAHHMGFSRDSQSQIVFHEAGHGLEELLRSQSALGGAKLDTFATELIGLTQRPGSMASDPPASASAAEKKDYQIGEGIAEWTRLLMVDPSAVQGLKFTAAVDAMTAAAYPKLAKALRDGARAVNAFQEKPAALRLMMFDAMPNANPSANEVIGGLIRMGEGFINSLSSGSRISKLDRTIFRAIRKQRDQVGMTYQQALDRSRQVRAKYTDPLLQAYNMILSIGQETQLAISGKGASKGLRVVGSDGKFNYFTRQAWVDLRNKIPASKVTEFDNAAYALEALSRWKSRGLEYKGMREGLTPDQLELIVAQARRDIPKFDELFAEQSAWFDAVVDLKDFGRLLKPGERDKILLTRATYWPLPAATTAGRGRGGRGRGNITTGLFRAKGHSGPTRQVDEVAEERARTAFEAYYWNRFGLMLYKNMLKVSADRTLPIEARALAGAQMVQMKMPQAVAATVSREEVIPWVLEAIKDQMEAALGFRPELKADDINLSWNFKDVWRPTKPGDINVVSLLVDGERRYFQLGDPAVFGMFSNPQVASKWARFMSWALGPMTQNWKRNITQGPVFAIRNLFRDIFSQTVLNPDPIAWIPGGTHVLGTINKFTKKYPQVFQEGLLLSRVQPTEAELVKSIQHGAIWQWFSEGWYTSQAKDPVTKLLATVLQPSNLLFPFWKAADLFNLIAPGAAAGALVGGPVGGVVGAVVGPAIGFTGQGMAAFFETAGREGAAVSVLRRGGTDEEALLKYWTAAGQFNEHAGVADARVVMGIPGFLNPMFQGTRNALQKLSDPDPKVRGTAWTRMMVMIPLVFTTAAVAAYLSMQRKDRDRERQRPIEDRMNFMDLNGFAIPFPYGPEGVMATVVYNAVMDDLLGRPMKDAEKTSLMLIKRVFDLGSPLQFLGPQFAAINEANMNWSNFRQRPIVSPWMAKLSASDQYYSTTPEFYQKLGEMFNYSPAKLQYIMQQAISRQADEMVRLMESIDGGRPIQESADVPFVGRLFVRDPIGFGSQAVRDADAIESRLQLLSTRLQAKGYGRLGLFDQDGNPEYPADRLSPDLQKLQIQLQYLQGLRKGLRTMEEVQALAKAYATAEQWSEERNARTMMTDLTQSLLMGNRDRIKTIDQALELLKKIAPASPKQQAADYLERRF